MDTEAFLRDLEERRDRISQAISLLKGNAHRNGRRRGRRKGTFSAAARKKISDAMKRRWASHKKAT